MSDAILLKLPDVVVAEIEAYSRADGVTKEQLIRTALDEYLFARRVRELRARVVPQAQAQGFHTDEDVFRNIS